MQTDRDIIAAYRAGELPALTAETLPAIAARQAVLNARFQAAMETGAVGGNPLPPHLGAIIAKAPTLERKRDRAAAVAALLKADKGRRSTLRRKRGLPKGRKSKAQTPVEFLVGAGHARR